MTDRIEGTEFRCPLCGSRRWGTDMTQPEWVGYCSECPFTWPRTEDAKYFHQKARTK